MPCSGIGSYSQYYLTMYICFHHAKKKHKNYINEWSYSSMRSILRMLFMRQRTHMVEVHNILSIVLTQSFYMTSVLYFVYAHIKATSCCKTFFARILFHLFWIGLPDPIHWMSGHFVTIIVTNIMIIYTVFTEI